MNWLDRIETELTESAAADKLRLCREVRRLRHENGWLQRRVNKHEPSQALKASEARWITRQVTELMDVEKHNENEIDRLRTELKIWKARAAQNEGPRVRAELPAEEPEKHWSEETEAEAQRYEVLPLP